MSSTRASISALPRGHEFVPASFSLAAGDVRAYLAAVGDANDYAGLVPPLAAVALGLAALQEQLSLPDGALHTGQDVEHLAPVLPGARLTLTGRVAQRSERQGFVISVIEFEIAAAGETAVRARTTIMAPGERA
ncbi:MAG: hypothetical protein ACYDEB_09820 [Dehalococcoidia bacterium]